MSSTETGSTTYIALGTRSLPYLLTGSSLEELESTLASAGILDGQGELHPQIEVFESSGARVENPFPGRRYGGPPEPPSDKEQVAYHARSAAVLATLAAMAAGEIGGIELTFGPPPPGTVRCNCALCYLTGQRC